MTSKPFVLKAAEIIYLNIYKIKKNDSSLDNKKAIQKFIETDEFEKLSTGYFHNEWLKLIKKNNNIDPETNSEVPNETINLLEIQRDTMMKELIKVPKLYSTKDNRLIELVDDAEQKIKMQIYNEYWDEHINFLTVASESNRKSLSL